MLICVKNGSPERHPVRTPIQWSTRPHDGFTTARRPPRPVIGDGEFGYPTVNVADQRRNPDSLLNWTERIIRTRKECPEIGWGDWRLLPRMPDHVLGLCHGWGGRTAIALHNFSDQPAAVRVPAGGCETLVSMLSRERGESSKSGRHTIRLEPYGYRWLRGGEPGQSITDNVSRVTSRHSPG
jgi:maltose alpha-D-glucosyltransferase/alpha-amylase